MEKLTITYDKEKCIGAERCVQIAPTFFSFNNEKADLKNSVVKNCKYVLIADCSPEQVLLFKESASICPVNAIEVKSGEEVMVSDTVETNEVEMVNAEYDDETEFVLDSAGYFLIRLNKGKIEVGFCNSRNKVVLRIIGEKPIDIYYTIINKNGLNIRKDHCAYLGRELQKAYIALQKGIDYVQDEELKL